MVIGAFPIAKLSVLLIKQISKPIANVIKERAKTHPFFRTYVCLPPAQFYHWCEVKSKMWMLNLGRPVSIPVLSQDMAIELGANLLGETIIFSIGAALLILEYNRQVNKETAKEEKRQQEMNYVTETIRDLYFTVQQHQTQLKELERIVLNLTSGKPVKVPPEFGKTTTPPQELPKSPPTSSTPQPTAVSHSHVPESFVTYSSSSTPYPDRGIILQALNYIQMDILNFTQSRSFDDRTYKQNQLHRREQGMVNEALDNMENELRSLF